MSMIAQSMLPEYRHEMANTRRALERVPDAAWTWKPHAKSMSMGELASHIASIPGWGEITMTMDVFELPAGFQPPFFATTAEVLAAFDNGVKACEACLAATTDAAMMAEWRMVMGGHEVMRMPRAAVMRSMIFNHLYHHRGQLTVYLRLKDVPVPSIYGPSADEGQMGGA